MSDLLTTLPETRPASTKADDVYWEESARQVGDIHTGTVLVVNALSGVAYLRDESTAQNFAVAKKHVGAKAFDLLRPGVSVKFCLNRFSTVSELRNA